MFADRVFQLPMETEIYYIQHTLMLVIPFYLMRIGGKDKTQSDIFKLFNIKFPSFDKWVS